MRSKVFRIYNQLAIAAVLSTACGGALRGGTIGSPPQPPGVHQPPAPLPVQPTGVNAFDIVTCAQPAHGNHCDAPITGVTVKVHTAVNPDTYDVKVSNADGYALFIEPDSLVDSDITFEAAAGYLPQTVGVLVSDLTKQHNVYQLYQAHVDPASFSDAQIRNVKTDLAGVYIDEIKPQCPVDPQTGIACVSDTGATARGVVNGILFTANYRIYTAAQRQIIRDVFTGKRPDAFGLVHHYTHYPISLFCSSAPDYHGIYPACATSAKVGLNEALHELWDAGLIPMGVAMQDDEPDDLTTPLSIAGIVDPSLVRSGTAYWEHYEVDCAMQKVRALFPQARLYYHNPTNTDAGYPDACYAHGSDAEYGALGGAEGWWRHFRDAYGGIGAWVQNSDGSVQDVVDRLADFVARFSVGYHGWPFPLDTVWFEDTNSVFLNFWNGGDERSLLDRSDQVLAAQPLCVEGFCGSLAGFGSGGRR